MDLDWDVQDPEDIWNTLNTGSVLVEEDRRTGRIDNIAWKNLSNSGNPEGLLNEDPDDMEDGQAYVAQRVSEGVFDVQRYDFMSIATEPGEERYEDLALAVDEQIDLGEDYHNSEELMRDLTAAEEMY